MRTWRPPVAWRSGPRVLAFVGAQRKVALHPMQSGGLLTCDDAPSLYESSISSPRLPL